MALVERLDAVEKLLQAKAEQLLEMIGHETKSREFHLGKLDEHAQVSKETQMALNKLEIKLHNEIAREQSARDVNLTQLENKMHTEIAREQGVREADIQELRAQAQNQKAFVDRMGTLESLVKQEKDVREADIYELREIVGGEQLARQGHHANVQEILEEERKAREQHMLHLNDHADRHDAHLNNHNAVIERLAELETTVQNQILGSQDQVLLSRVNELERHLVNEASARDAAWQQQQGILLQALEQEVSDVKASAAQVATHLNNEIKHLREDLDTHSHDFDAPEEDSSPTAPQPYVVTRTITLPPQQVPPPPTYLVQPSQPPQHPPQHMPQPAPPAPQHPQPQPPSLPPQPQLQKSVTVAGPHVTYGAPTTPTNLNLGSVQIPPLASVMQQPITYPENPIVSPTSTATKRKSGSHKVTTSTAKYNNSPAHTAPLVA